MSVIYDHVIMKCTTTGDEREAVCVASYDL